MNLHNEIMNIQIDEVKRVQCISCGPFANQAYAIGHRDARHASAELALKTEARIEELENQLVDAKSLADYWFDKYQELQDKISEVE